MAIFEHLQLQPVAGVVDEQSLTGPVVDVHGHLAALPPAVEMVAELDVLIAVRVFPHVLLPEQRKRPVIRTLRMRE